MCSILIGEETAARWIREETAARSACYGREADGRGEVVGGELWEGRGGGWVAACGGKEARVGREGH